jgi:hypothetical protein
MIKNSSKQTGSAHVVIIVILVIALIGTLGFVFWQNFFASKDTTPQQEAGQIEKSSSSSENKSADLDKGYLVLKDWGVKFKLPQTKSEIVYYKEAANGVEYYDFTTKRVEALGETCVEPNSQGFVTRLGSISRSVTKNELHPSAYAINNNKPLGGFYYYNSGAQSLCATAEGSTDIQVEDRKLVNDMLMNPILIEK